MEHHDEHNIENNFIIALNNKKIDHIQIILSWKHREEELKRLLRELFKSKCDDNITMQKSIYFDNINRKSELVFDKEIIEMFDNFLSNNKIINKIQWYKLEVKPNHYKSFNQLFLNNKQITEIEFIAKNDLEYGKLFKNCNLAKLVIRSPYMLQLTDLLLIKSTNNIHLLFEEMKDDDIIDLDEMENVFDNTESLKYIYINIKEKDIHNIYKFLTCFCNSKNKSITGLSLYSKYKIDGKMMDLIKNYIANNKTIIDLYLCVPGMIEDVEYLIENKTIETLFLNNKKYHGFDNKFLVAEIIEKNETITNLTLRGAPDQNSYKILFDAMKKSCALRKIECVEHVECDKDFGKLNNEIKEIHKIKKQYLKTYLIQYASHGIIPMIQTINEYFDLLKIEIGN
ncbi:MAG: hypothetical protein Edafosvirus6_37 [Edafosvirus sp.]|uniref:Uncharacterized protein n=1 Tax=Edafosvirus sp. TaxID=2487765 RepID=A0A3G4ZTH3_9VIRU|nr:MAG: hypothetical protein Edafosvirus6_37 [Edafosvirus sp.]